MDTVGDVFIASDIAFQNVEVRGRFGKVGLEGRGIADTGEDYVTGLTEQLD